MRTCRALLRDKSKIDSKIEIYEMNHRGEGVSVSTTVDLYIT